MKRVYENKIGECQLIIAQAGETYTGIIRKGGQEQYRESHEDLDRLVAILNNEAGKLHPNYIGIDGAIKRFKKFFPLGFDDPYYKIKERDYKDKQKEVLDLIIHGIETPKTKAERIFEITELLGPNVATKALLNEFEKKTKSFDEMETDLSITSSAAASKITINLLSKFENARLHEMLSFGANAEGSDYLLACKKISETNTMNRKELEEKLKEAAKAIKPFGSVTWPLVTILPYFWNPAEHMFLKPVATKDHADRVGHEFTQKYDSSINLETYLSLLDLADWTEKEISSLKPKDRIDVQSFIWVVGNYKDVDLEEINKFRAT